MSHSKWLSGVKVMYGGQYTVKNRNHAHVSIDLQETKWIDGWNWGVEA